MKKLIKQLFSKQKIKYWIPGLSMVLLSLILDRTIPEFSVANIIVRFAQILFNILIFKIPIWILLALSLLAFLVFWLKTRTLNEKQKFILCILDERDVRLIDLAFAYKKCWPNESRIKTKCFKILSKLERLKLSKLGCLVGGINTVQEEQFEATDKGKKRMKKIEERIKDKAEKIYDELYREARGLEPLDMEIEDRIEEIVFILKFPANEEEKKELKSVLRFNYTNQFTDKKMSDFNYVWSILERENLVEQGRGITGYGGSYSELPFYITNRGLQLYNDYKDILED